MPCLPTHRPAARVGHHPYGPYMVGESPMSETYDTAILDQVEATIDRFLRVRSEIGRAIFGQERVVEESLITLLSGGHVLLVGVPGLAQTPLVETPGVVLGL